MDWTAIGRHGQVLKNGPALSEGLKVAKSELPQKAAKRKPTADELAAVRGPRRTRKRAGGDKVAIAFKYCYCQIDSTKQSFKEALHKGEHRVSECWINTIYDTSRTSCSDQTRPRT